MRSNTDIDRRSIDLSAKPVQPVAILEATATSETNQAASDIILSDNDFVLDSSLFCLQCVDTEPIFDVSFSVGEDVILTLEPSVGNSVKDSENMYNTHDEEQDSALKLALSAAELSLTPPCFEECFDLNIEPNNPIYKTWRHLKNKVRASHNFEAQNETSHNLDDKITSHNCTRKQ